MTSDTFSSHFSRFFCDVKQSKAKGHSQRTRNWNTATTTATHSNTNTIAIHRQHREEKRSEEKNSHKTHRELKRAQLKFPKAMNFSDSAAIYEHAPEEEIDREREREWENKRQCINKALKLQFNVIELCEICHGIEASVGRGPLKSINNIFDLKLKLNSIKTFLLRLTDVRRMYTHTCGTYIFCPRLMSLIICIIYKNSHVMIKIYAHTLAPEDTLPTSATATATATATASTSTSASAATSGSGSSSSWASRGPTLNK